MKKGKKVTVQLTVDQTMLFPAAKVRYRVRCRNTFAGYARNFWWNGAGLMRGMQCMEKRVVLSHVGSAVLLPVPLYIRTSEALLRPA